MDIGIVSGIYLLGFISQLIFGGLMITRSFTAINNSTNWLPSTLYKADCSNNEEFRFTYFVTYELHNKSLPCNQLSVWCPSNAVNFVGRDASPEDISYAQSWFCWILLVTCTILVGVFGCNNYKSYKEAKRIENRGYQVKVNCKTLVTIASILKAGLVGTLSICFIHIHLSIRHGCLAGESQSFNSSYLSAFTMLKFGTFPIYCVCMCLAIATLLCCCSNRSSDIEQGASLCICCLPILFVIVYAAGFFYTIAYFLLGGPSFIEDGSFNTFSLIYFIACFDSIIAFILCKFCYEGKSADKPLV